MKKSMFLYVVLAITGMVILASVVPSVSASSKTVTLRAAFYQPPTHRTIANAKEAFANLEELTEGRVKLEIYHSGTLCKPSEIWDSLNRGLADLSVSPLVNFRTNIPWWGVEEVPDGPRNYWGYHEAAQNGLLEIYQNGLYSKNMKITIAGMFCAGLGQIMTKGKKVVVPEDLKGLKILAPGPIHVEILKTLGAAPVIMHYSDLYEALTTGLIDGSWGNMSLFGQFKAQEPADYLCRRIFGGPYAAILVSEAGLARLSKTDAAIFLELAKKFALMEEIFSNIGEIPLIDKWIAPYLKEIVYPTPEQNKQWDEALAPFIKKWKDSAGEQGLKALEIINNYSH